MELKGIRIGFALTGSHCTIEKVIREIDNLINKGADVTPIISYSVQKTDSRFGKAYELINEIISKTGKKPIMNIVEAEPIGPKKLFDIMVIAPCSGNTLAKLATGITDTPVLMAAKAHLRNNRPLVLGISTNDGLSINAKNLGLVLNMKNIYIVPFGQDNPTKKINSIVSHMNLIPDTIKEALKGRQLQPVLREYKT
ncbi:MAG: dipicolinate synthase subunit B [Clostridia bacterium]|nr:dipicolinate synthase subunit B [Clostridia bacterium]